MRNLLTTVILLTLASFQIQADFRLESAKGKNYQIAVNENSIQEKNAAEHLQKYLSKMFPLARFQIISPFAAVETAENVIYVGETEQLKKQGIDLTKFGPEELLILQKGKKLYLAGGYPRGTLYSVFEFLEKNGVIHAAQDTCHSPVKQELKLKEMEIRRKPAFKARGICANSFAPDFKLFNKCNSYRVGSAKNGWYYTYGEGGHCHTFRFYSRNFPIDDPSVFAMGKNGRRLVPTRQGDVAPLCTSSPKTVELIWQLMEKSYRKTRERCLKQNRPLPELYEISLDDELTVCQCRECRKITEEEGCYTGNMLRLVNEIAGRMEKLDPKVRISMIVYQNTLYFPKRTRPAKNVLPRICVHDNEWLVNVLAESANPLTHKNNRAFLKVFTEWEEHSASLGVWEYWTYYTKQIFPFVALNVYFENLKYYRKHKVENAYLSVEQHTDSFQALKMYLGLKLMDDPARNRKELITGFMNAYYGKAAGIMTEYLNYLDSEVRKESELAPLGARRPDQYKYLNADFLLKCYAFLDEAEKRVSQDARSLRHVHWEYIALDYALVEQWKKFAGRFPFDKQFVLERIRNYRTDQIQCLSYPKEKKSQLAKLDSYLKGHMVDLPIPEGIHGDYIFDFNANQLYVTGKKSSRVKDEVSPAGIAVLLTSPDGYYVHNGKKVKFHQLPFTAGVYNDLSHRSGPAFRLDGKDIPQDEKYHLYKMGKYPFVKGSRIWMHWAWALSFWPRNAYTETIDYPYDVYISLKFTGPSYVKGSEQKDAVYVDRIILARVNLLSEPFLPKELGGVPKEKIIEVSQYLYGQEETDLDSVTGKAVVLIPAPNAKKNIAGVRMEVYDKAYYEMTKKDIASCHYKIPDEKYHWYKIRRTSGNAAFQGSKHGATVCLENWKIGARLPKTFKGKYDCWVLVKAEGPLYVDGSTKENKVYLSRVLLVSIK